MKKRQRKQRNDDELNFWQPASDMFSALLLILMLIILMLGLYLVRIPEHDQRDPWAGDTYAEGNEEQPENTDSPQPTIFFWFPGAESGEDGGGGETPHPTYVDAGSTPSASPSPTISPTPDLPGGGAAGGGGGEGGGEGAGEGPGEEPDRGMKSAVYVMLVDAETDRTVKEANVEFELYGSNHALQILNVYYPERLSFRFFETTENGTFYLPEKIPLEVYELHELTEPEGYDQAENVEFILNAVYDWSDPLVVEVPIYPSRNIIRVQMTDAELGVGVPGGVFSVVAAENVITADGTLRYRAGQTVCDIVCDERGYGESEEIYLGHYYLRQTEISQYYVGIQEETEVEVVKKSLVLPPVQTFACERTKVRLTLADELYPTRALAGVTYQIIPDNYALETLELVTNTSGTITLDTLEKGTAYRVVQANAIGNYLLDTSPHVFSVAADGRIQGEAALEMALFNHMIRVNIGVTDEFSDVQVPNVSLAMYDASDNSLVRVWTSTSAPVEFTNLHAGPYYILQNGEESMRQDVYVRDQAEPQQVTLYTSYLLHYLIIAGIALATLLLVVILVFILVRRRKKKKAAQNT